MMSYVSFSETVHAITDYIVGYYSVFMEQTYEQQMELLE
ncbi:transposase (partial) [Escherichia coli]|nr:transposase (partial) [Escherichia coli]